MLNKSRLLCLFFVVVLASFLAAACSPKSPASGPDINNLVATGMLGTRQAWAIGTIVSATNAALAARAPTPVPTAAGNPAANTPSPLPTVEDPCANQSAGGSASVAKRAYASSSEGYCLFYPGDFFVNKPVSGGVEFLGPALDNTADPLRAYIRIAYREPVQSRTLDEIARSVWKEASPGYHISNIQLGGQDALVADDLVFEKSRRSVRQVLFIHNNAVYLITLSPFDANEPYKKALPDVERFWMLALRSFVFK
jgi:hypothetical protein